jgi:NCAIR mutase (PurE)-related protein
LERFDYKVTQRRGAVPTEATGTMTLLYAPVPAEAKYEEVATKLTEREQGDLATKVKAELTTNAAKATKLAWDKKAPINVDAYGQVSLGDRQVGDVRDILPADQIPEGLKS